MKTPTTPSYGFALTHPYGIVSIGTAFLLAVLIQDFFYVFGALEEQHPYIHVTTVVGTLFFFILSFTLAIIKGGKDSNSVSQSFLPIFLTGFLIWLSVCLAINILFENYFTSSLIILVAGVTLWNASRLSDVQFIKPSEIQPQQSFWPIIIIGSNAASVGLIIQIYLENIPAEFTVAIVVIYALTTVFYPFAIFTNAYRYAYKRDKTWKTPVLFGCLGMATLLSLGAINWITTTIYAVVQTTTWIKSLLISEE